MRLMWLIRKEDVVAPHRKVPYLIRGEQSTPREPSPGDMMPIRRPASAPRRWMALTASREKAIFRCPRIPPGPTHSYGCFHDPWLRARPAKRARANCAWTRTEAPQPSPSAERYPAFASARKPYVPGAEKNNVD